MLYYISAAESIRAMCLILKVNKFYRDTTTKCECKGYHLCTPLSQYKKDIINDIENYIHNLEIKKELTKDEAKELKKYLALVMALRVYRKEKANG